MGKLLIKLLQPLIEQIFFKMFDQQAEVFKLKKTLDYVELPNEVDKSVEKLKVVNEMVKSQLKDMTNDLNKMKNKFEKFKKIRSL